MPADPLRRSFNGLQGLLLLSLIFFGCAKSKPQSELIEGGNEVQLGESAPLPALFPHSEGWSDPAAHGTSVNQYGASLCLKCHPEDVAVSGGPPACHGCHSLYPHLPNWVDKTRHGGWVLDNGKESCKSQCHGADLKGGLSGRACVACHEIYPHQQTWKTDHGKRMLEIGRTICQDCHGADLKTTVGGINCYSCHGDYPHPEAAVWVPYQGGHGEWVKTQRGGSRETCKPCHGADLTKTIQGENCFSCHASFPHADRWGEFEQHGRYTLLHSREDCQPCHGGDYLGSRDNPSCRSCHPPYPHLSGWRNQPGEPQPHGLYVETAGSASCATAHCHGVDLVPVPGVTQGVGCDTCHQAYPHVAGWRSGLVHGPAAVSDISICKACHGTLLDRARPGYQSCANCHPSYLQHGSTGIGIADWGTAGHGPYLLNPPVNGDLTECRLCHGSDLGGGISNRSCRTCHPVYPHDQPGWASREGHGNYVRVTLGGDLTACRTCHGSDLSGGHAGVSCTSCHADYPHAAGAAGAAGWAAGTGHGQSYSSRFTAIFTTATCWNCHGNPVSFDSTQTKAGLAAQSTCYSCHWAYPHTRWTASLGSAVWDWEPVTNISPCGSREVINAMGHVMYLLDSPLFTDAAGTRPTPADPGVIGAIQNTCGGATGGSCHMDGNRSYRTDHPMPLCGGYCHSTARPYPPTLPPCPTGGSPCAPPLDLCIPEEFEDPFCYDPLTESCP